MPLERLMQLLSEKRRKALAMVCVSMILSFSQAASAQSGRKNKNATAPQPPVTTETKTETPTNPPPKKAAPYATVIVGGDKFGTSMYVLSSYVDDAIKACIDRIKESSAIEAIGGGNMTRKEALDRAKKETTSYVLWLELRLEQDAVENSLSISYYLFAPKTAKILASGNVYLGNRSVRSGPVGVGIPSATKQMPIQYQIKEGGQEVADRVVSKFPSIKKD